MNTANHISPEDLALFALQCLPEADLKDAVEHLEHCEQCRNEVGQIQGDLVAYAMTAELHTPPQAARERLLRRVGKEKKMLPPEPQPVAEPVLAARNNSLFQADNVEEMPVRSSSSAASWLGWAVAAGVAVVAGLQFHQKQNLQGQLSSESAKYSKLSADSEKAQAAMLAFSDPSAFPVALHAPSDPKAPSAPKKPEAHVAYDADKGALVFVATNLAPLETYKTYELWVLPADGKDPIPAGTFKPDGNSSATVVMPDIPKGITAKGFGVTIEDQGGSKSPTMSNLALIGE